MVRRESAMRVALLTLSCLFPCGPGFTQDPGILINGAAPTLLERLVLVDWNCGEAIPPGDYWLDVNSGAWGYARGPQQGRMSCHPSVAQGGSSSPQAPAEESDCESKYRMHEDRMCYCYHVC